MTRKERQEAIAQIERISRNLASIGETVDYTEFAIEALEQEPRWIPVSERLPKDGEIILFSTKTDRVFEGRYFDDNTDCQWYAFRDETFARNNVVIAWQPLPKPYNVESESKE